HQDGVPQVVLRLQQKRRLEVGGQLRDVQQRAETLVQEAPAWRAAVVVARVVGRAQRSDRALDQALARVQLDRGQAGRQIDREQVRRLIVVPAQKLPRAA